MKQVNCLLTFLFLFSLICPSWQIKAQSSGKNLNEEPVVIQNYVGNGDVSNTSQTPAPQNKKLINQVRELSKQLNVARESGNTQLTKELENQINTLVGSKPVTPGFGPQAIPLTESIILRNGDDPRTINQITSGGILATATTTQNTDGRIWVATTHYAAGLTDTLRIFYSDDGGLTWAYLTSITYAADNVDFIADDIDIEVLNNGTDWYIYISGTINYNSEAYSFVARFKTDGSEFFHSYLPKNSGTNQYWTRIVSDYPSWSASACVYIVATLDSALDASTKDIWTRAFIIQYPYAASPTILNRNNNGNAYFWWYGIPAPIDALARTDVAYYDSLTTGDRIVTSTIFANSPNDISAYMTYSDNYMATIPYLYNVLSLTYKSSSPIMSFSGGDDQLKGCITTVWNYMNSPDTDPRYIVTNDGGATWNQGYLDATSDTTLKADVIGLRGIDGHFKFAWINSDAPNPEFLYRTGYLNGSFVLTDPVPMYGEGIFPSDEYGGRAGYKLTGTDSCFAVFEGLTGSAYGVSGCDDPVSVENNNVLPANYSISQNYPNPFNPSTNIKFNLPSTSNVTIKVFDVLGREIAEIMNGTMEAGSHEVQFSSKELSSGIYFYKLEVQEVNGKTNFVDIKKMVLMK